MNRPKFKTCGRCKGKGYYHAKLKDLGKCTYEWNIVSCDMPGCHGGIVNLEENHKAFC